MSPEHTVTAIKEICKKDSGDEQIWKNKGTQYHWNIGRSTPSGLINGVVRKLAGIDASGFQIWVVAGSFKINPDGTIARWTGLPRETQKLAEGVSRIKSEVLEKVGT
jgi:hypothetical protein